MCLTPISVTDPKTKEVRMVPCNSCPECLACKRLAWSTRIYLEIMHWDNPTYFFTLTYSDENLPIVNGVPVVTPSDLRCFVDSVVRGFRKKYSHRLRFFFISEYGPTTGRPHYHGFFFNWPQSKRKAYEFALQHWPYGQMTIRCADPSGGVYAVKDMISPTDIPEGAFNSFLLRSVRPAIGCHKTLINDSISRDDVRQLRFRDISGKLVPVPSILLKKTFTEEELSLLQFKRKLDPDYTPIESQSLFAELFGQGLDLEGYSHYYQQAKEHVIRSMKDKRQDQTETIKYKWQITS